MPLQSLPLQLLTEWLMIDYYMVRETDLPILSSSSPVWLRVGICQTKKKMTENSEMRHWLITRREVYYRRYILGLAFLHGT